MQRTVKVVLLWTLLMVPVSWAAEDKPLDENSPEVKQMVLLSLREPTSEEVEQLYKRKTVQRAAERS